MEMDVLGRGTDQVELTPVGTHERPEGVLAQLANEFSRIAQGGS